MQVQINIWVVTILLINIIAINFKRLNTQFKFDTDSGTIGPTALQSLLHADVMHTSPVFSPHAVYKTRQAMYV
jgi:hypothetical protein